MNAKTSYMSRDVTKQSYGWIHLLGVAYCLAIGVYSVLSWTADGKNAEAVICAGAQLLAIVFAILGRRAFNGDVQASGVVCIVIAGGLAWWASQGIAHAWQAEGELAMAPMVLLLAALEPALFLLAEHIEQANIKKAEKEAADKKETDEALKAAREANQKREERAHAERMAAIAAQSGADNLLDFDAARKSATAMGAGALAFGAGIGLPADTLAANPVPEPASHVAQVGATFDGTDEWDMRAANSDKTDPSDSDEARSESGPKVWQKGPKPPNSEKFQEVLNIVASDSEINPTELARRVGVSWNTAKQWRGWAQAILCHAPNSDLLDFASASQA